MYLFKLLNLMAIPSFYHLGLINNKHCLFMLYTTQNIQYKLPHILLAQAALLLALWVFASMSVCIIYIKGFI